MSTGQEVQTRSPRPLVSPKGWARAGVGIGMLWGGGIPLVGNSKYFSIVEVSFIESQKIRFPSLFWKRMIPDSRLSRIYKTNLKDFSARVLSNIFGFVVSTILRFPKLIYFGGMWYFFICEVVLGIQSKINRFWESWTRPPSPTIMQSTTVWVFGK